MKSYLEITHLGRLRRQFSIAKALLAQYPIDVAQIRLVSAATNYIYRVRTADGTRFAFRLAALFWRSYEDALLEAAWLDALAKDTHIPVPKILRTRRDETVARMDDPWAALPRHGILMSWQPGVLLAHQLTESNLENMGVLFGELHLHGATWKPPQAIQTRVFDHFLSRGEPDVLFAKEQLGAYSKSDLVTVRNMYTRVAREYQNLDKADLRVIHCDLWHDNIKVYRGQLAPFDFEDTILGYRLHDIAMAMLDLAEEVGTVPYQDLFSAFQRGYETRLAWPEGNLAVLQMGRVLWRMNWFGRHLPDRFADTVKFYADLFRRFERSGRLSDPLLP